MQRSFPRRLGALDDLFAWVSDFLSGEQAGEAVRFAVKFAVEEMFVNMVRYNPGCEDEILVGLSRTGGQLEVTLTGVQAEPFDITGVAEYDGGLPLTERRPGGLGIHLTRKLMDRVAYKHDRGRGTITLTKTLGARDV